MLLFLKMVHEKTETGLFNKHPLPEGCRWQDISDKDGITLLNDYKRILLTLSTGKDEEGKGQASTKTSLSKRFTPMHKFAYVSHATPSK